MVRQTYGIRIYEQIKLGKCAKYNRKSKRQRVSVLRIGEMGWIRESCRKKEMEFGRIMELKEGRVVNYAKDIRPDILFRARQNIRWTNLKELLKAPEKKSRYTSQKNEVMCLCGIYVFSFVNLGATFSNNICGKVCCFL